jgi:hypothetical protein
MVAHDARPKTRVARQRKRFPVVKVTVPLGIVEPLATWADTVVSEANHMGTDRAVTAVVVSGRDGSWRNIPSETPSSLA